MPAAKPPRSIGITALLSVSIAGLVLLCAGLVLALSMQAAWRNTIELLRARAELATALIEEQVRAHVNPALEISRYLHEQIATGKLQPDTPGELVTAFKGALAAAPQIAGLVLWDNALNKLEVRRSTGGVVTVHRQPGDDDPALRAMVEQARRRGEPFWGVPNEGDDQANYVYSLTPLSRGARYWGVMATGVTINNLSAILKRVGERRGMTAFILYGEQVLAHPWLDLSTTRRFENGLSRLPTIAELGDPILRQFRASEVVNQPPPGGVEIRVINHPNEHREYFAFSKTNREFGEVAWQIGIYAPGETLDQQLDRLFFALIGGGVVLLLALLCALIIARKISRPIRSLAEHAEHIGQLALGKVGTIPRSGIRELDDQAGAFNRMVDGLRWFETYVPKRLVRRLMGGGAELVASREAELTVLFTDIIGFTALSESMPPGEVGAMLNAHFEVVSRCIEAEGGTLDKYIGDAVMAFWGAPEAQADHAARACRAALAIARELAADATQVRIKMAIHSGALLVGNIGAASRMNYTVIGDTVNTCARIESLCGQFDDGGAAVILVSDETARLAGGDAGLRFEAVGGHAVKGRAAEVRVSRLYRADDADGTTTADDECG